MSTLSSSWITIARYNSWQTVTSVRIMYGRGYPLTVSEMQTSDPATITQRRKLTHLARETFRETYFPYPMEFMFVTQQVGWWVGTLPCQLSFIFTLIQLSERLYFVEVILHWNLRMLTLNSSYSTFLCILVVYYYYYYFKYSCNPYI